MKQKSYEYRLLTELYFRLLPYQVLLLAINAVNGIVDALYASNVIGTSAMSAIGIFGPINIFLSAASLMLVSGSQILYGRYVTTKREKLPELFTVDLPRQRADLWIWNTAIVIAIVIAGKICIFVFY